MLRRHQRSSSSQQPLPVLRPVLRSRPHGRDLPFIRIGRHELDVYGTPDTVPPVPPHVRFRDLAEMAGAESHILKQAIILPQLKPNLDAVFWLANADSSDGADGVWLCSFPPAEWPTLGDKRDSKKSAHAQASKTAGKRSKANSSPRTEAPTDDGVMGRSVYTLASRVLLKQLGPVLYNLAQHCASSDLFFAAEWHQDPVKSAALADEFCSQVVLRVLSLGHELDNTDPSVLRRASVTTSAPPGGTSVAPRDVTPAAKRQEEAAPLPPTVASPSEPEGSVENAEGLAAACRRRAAPPVAASCTYDEQLTQPGVVPPILEEARRLLAAQPSGSGASCRPMGATDYQPGASPPEEAPPIAPPVADGAWLKLGVVADQALQRREMHVAHREASLMLMHNQLQEKNHAWQLHVAEQQAKHKEQRDFVEARRVALEAENTRLAVRMNEIEQTLMQQLRGVESERQAIRAQQIAVEMERKRLEIVSPSLKLLLLRLEDWAAARGSGAVHSRPARALASLPLADLVTAESQLALLANHVREEFRARLESSAVE